MYNYYNRRKFIYSLILILILAIGIGYAYLTSNLSIAGNTNVATNSWNIHFENLNVTTGSVTASTPASIQSNNTSITYTIDLNRPKEYYEFTLDVKNDGTLPGKVSISTLNGITSDAEPIIDYSIKYTNGNSVSIGDILNSGAKKRIKVRVYYKDDINPSDFPSSDLSLTLTYTLQYVQSEEDEISAGTIIQTLASNNSCIIEYDENVTDQVGETVTASNVYFDKCSDKRNIIFGGFCWQAIRTTETGGLKMIYNGEPVSGKCLSTRSDHKGIVQTNATYQTIDSSYLYGSTFTYNKNNNTFTLVDTFTSTWSNSTYQNLIGKFTCKSSSNSCTTIYEINQYITPTNAYVSYYTLGNTNYAQMGTSAFNADSNTPAMLGYMFNKEYKYNTRQPSTTEYKYGNSFTYSNGTYSLSGTTQNISDWTTGYTEIDNTHYTCWNTTGTCTTISYIYNTDSSKAYYINISDGKGVNDALNEMLSNNDVNRYNSSVKGIVDNWYKQELNTFSDKLEDVVFCNARNVFDMNGWDPNGSMLDEIKFKGDYSSNSTDLSCAYDTDQFALSNNKAKLTYPVGLVTIEELRNLGSDNNSDNLRKTGAFYNTITPSSLEKNLGFIGHVSSVGQISYTYLYVASGIRPVISLGEWNKISSGSGTESDPWIIQE